MRSVTHCVGGVCAKTSSYTSPGSPPSVLAAAPDASSKWAGGAWRATYASSQASDTHGGVKRVRRHVPALLGTNFYTWQPTRRISATDSIVESGGGHYESDQSPPAPAEPEARAASLYNSSRIAARVSTSSRQVYR